MSTVQQKPKASVDDLAVELRQLNERAERFEQYLSYASTQRAATRKAGRWAMILCSIGLGLFVVGGAMLRQLLYEQEQGLWASQGKPQAIDMLIEVRNSVNNIGVSLVFFALLAGLIWGASKERS